MRAGGGREEGGGGAGVWRARARVESGCAYRFLLVVAAVEEHRAGVELLEGEERERDLDAAVAPVNEVAVEEVRPRRRREAVRPEDVHEVAELAVQIADDGELRAIGHGELDHVRQLREQLALPRQQLLHPRARRQALPLEGGDEVEHSRLVERGGQVGWADVQVFRHPARLLRQHVVLRRAKLG